MIKKQISPPTTTTNLNIDNIASNDTISISIISDSIHTIRFNSHDSVKIDLKSQHNIKIVRIDSNQLSMIIDRNTSNGYLKLIINGKSIVIHVKSVWMIDGFFKFDDPFGSNNNPVSGAECDLWVKNDEIYERLFSTWTDEDGYFCFFPDRDTVYIALWSKDVWSVVFYAEDSCFDFSWFENYPIHQYTLGVTHLSEEDYTIPMLYTTISEYSRAAPFHLLSIIRYAHNSFGYPFDSTFKNIFQAHNISIFIPGDANDNDAINIMDAVYIINFLYKNGPEPPNMSAADLNADCTVNILDITYLTDYLYESGPAPLVGCYNYYPN